MADFLMGMAKVKGHKGQTPGQGHCQLGYTAHSQNVNILLKNANKYFFIIVITLLFFFSFVCPCMLFSSPCSIFSAMQNTQIYLYVHLLVLQVFILTTSIFPYSLLNESPLVPTTPTLPHTQLNVWVPGHL
jgi:hypothetical protein